MIIGKHYTLRYEFFHDEKEVTYTEFIPFKFKKGFLYSPLPFVEYEYPFSIPHSLF